MLRSIVDTPAKLKNSLNMRRPWLLTPYTSPKRKLINQWQPNGDASGTDIGPFSFYLDGFDKPRSNHPSQGVPHPTTSDKPPIATAKAVDASDASDPRGSDPKTGAITSRAGSFVWHGPGFGVHGNQKQTHEGLNGESGKSVMELK